MSKIVQDHLGNMTRFVHRDELKWPLYTSDQIRIKKFDDGTHYYAYIGDAQVRDDNGVLKWDTEEAARAAPKNTATQNIQNNWRRYYYKKI